MSTLLGTRTTLLLLLITVSAIMAMQILAPALPAIAADFEVAAGTAQLTLTLFLVSYALFQLVYGPASDRLGRRPVLLFGLGVYVLASFFAGFAPNIELLIAARFFQALGSCVVLVLGNAIARDAYGEKGALQVIAYVAISAGFASAAAPYLGGLIVSWLGWRANLYLTGIVALGTFVAVFVLFRETLPAERRTKVRGRGLRESGALLTNPLFLGYAGSSAFVNGAFFAFFSGSPFVAIDILGLSPTGFGLFTIAAVGGFLFGAGFAPRLGRTLGTVAPILIGTLLGAVAGGSLVASELAGAFTLAGFAIAAFLMGFGNGFVIPNAVAACVNIKPEYAGTASAVTGSAQAGAGAIGSILVAVLHDGTALPVSVVWTGMGACAFLAALVAMRHARRAAAAAPMPAAAED